MFMSTKIPNVRIFKIFVSMKTIAGYSNNFIADMWTMISDCYLIPVHH